VQIAAATLAGNRLRQTVHENWAKSLKKVAIWCQNESQLYTTMTLFANEIKVVPYYYAVCMACGKEKVAHT